MVKRYSILLTFFILVASFWSAGVTGTEKNAVQSLDPTGLKNLMTDEATPYLIVAMAAWCGPCRKELPSLSKLYTQYQSRGIKIVGISLDLEGPGAMQPIVDKLGVNFPVYWVGEKAVKNYDIYAIPMLYLIKNGKLTKLVKAPTLEITTPAFWSSIDAIGKALDFDAGTCGKSDPMQGVPVWFGGPDIRLRDIVLV